MLTDIPSASLRQMVKLSERKEALLAQIQQIDREMRQLQQPAGTKRAKAPIAALKRRDPRAKRGSLKEKLLTTLRAAGKRGLTIHQLSAKTGARPANLYVWFNETGSKTPGIKRLSRGKYALLP